MQCGPTLESTATVPSLPHNDVIMKAGATCLQAALDDVVAVEVADEAHHARLQRLDHDRNLRASASAMTSEAGLPMTIMSAQPAALNGNVCGNAFPAHCQAHRLDSEPLRCSGRRCRTCSLLVSVSISFCTARVPCVFSATATRSPDAAAVFSSCSTKQARQSTQAHSVQSAQVTARLTTVQDGDTRLSASTYMTRTRLDMGRNRFRFLTLKTGRQKVGQGVHANRFQKRD